MLRFGHCILGTSAALFLAAGLCAQPARKVPSPAVDAPSALSPAKNTAAPGEKLARQICAGCHLFPEPDILDKKTWEEQILPRMETLLGVSPPDYSKSPEGDLLKRLKIYPDEPLISKADWNAIVAFYLRAAPSAALPQDPRPEIQVGLKQFDVAPANFRRSPPLTTLASISPSTHRILAGDDGARALAILNPNGQLLESVAIDNVPISVVEKDQGLYLTGLGSFQPSELQKGALYFLEKQGSRFASPKIILEDLPRAAQAEFADFNRDGKIDFAMCLFGNHRGRFSWFENLGHDQYEEHVLIDKSGAIHCVAYDFNQDGITDLGVLVAQESEAFYIFTNDGKGRFNGQLVFQKQPAFGHNYFELADFNGDGRMDLLVVNGDNGEYASPMKKYHGVRIYLNRGANRFEEAYFFPLNGAIKAVARDFDGDGDLDIAVISFFPDYLRSPRESFVYLENRGGLVFAPFTFPQCISGRWLVMDAGDVDGDGDIDIVLGSYIRGPTPVPDFLSANWEKQGPSLMILKNRLR